MKEIFGIFIWLLLSACYIHGVYMSLHEGFWSFLFVVTIFPWGIIKGFIGFF